MRIMSLRQIKAECPGEKAYILWHRPTAKQFMVTAKAFSEFADKWKDDVVEWQLKGVL